MTICLFDRQILIPDGAHAYYPLTCYIHEGNDYEGLELAVDGESMDYELQEIGFDPSLFR
ncbi:MAG: hypothetical protein K2N46_13695 [Lachnospiraceae bacterium]|nr:hypothetical protein [Lachnospiraceae bacterium]